MQLGPAGKKASRQTRGEGATPGKLGQRKANGWTNGQITGRDRQTCTHTNDYSISRAKRHELSIAGLQSE